MIMREFADSDAETIIKWTGRKMLELAKEYAVKVLNARKLTLGVFDVNTAALSCYKSVGFTETGCDDEAFEVLGESWKCIELECVV